MASSRKKSATRRRRVRPARTGVSGDEALTLSENGLTLPEAPTELVVIVVLRDERGGATWREARLRVE